MQDIDKHHQIRLHSCLDGKVELGPEEVVLGLINTCQLRCVTCWYWSPFLENPSVNGHWEKQRIDKALCFKIFDELSAMHVDKLLISGQGEPFLHPDIMDIIAYAKRKIRRLSVASNGLCLNEKKAKTLTQLLDHNDRFCVSVSGASAESYAAYHGTGEGSWDKLLKNLKILSEADLEEFRMFQIINNVTSHEIEQMLYLSAELKTSLSFKFASIPKGTERFQLSPDQVAELRENVPKWKKLAQDLNVTVNWDVFSGQLDEQHQFPIKDIGCYSGYMYSRIEADGSVYFCCRTEDVFKVGNISETPFKDIWFNAPQMKRHRLAMREQRYLPECNSCLNWGPNFRIKKELEQLEYAALTGQGCKDGY